MASTTTRTTTPRRRKGESFDARCDRIGEAIAQIVRARQPGADIDLEAEAPPVIAALERDFSVFLALDERPGRYDGYGRPGRAGYHSLLRTIRNSPVWGPRMFATFRG